MIYPTHAQYKRRIFLINPRFQFQFLGFLIFISALVIVSVYSADHYFFNKFYDYGKSMHLPETHVFFTFLKQQEGVMNAIFLWTSLILLSVIIPLGMILSHRIAGPLHRFHRHLQAAAHTHKHRSFRQRKGDFFPEIASAYNAQLPDALAEHKRKKETLQKAS